MDLRHIKTVTKYSREPNTSIAIAKKPKNEGLRFQNFTESNSRFNGEFTSSQV